MIRRVNSANQRANNAANLGQDRKPRAILAEPCGDGDLSLKMTNSGRIFGAVNFTKQDKITQKNQIILHSKVGKCKLPHVCWAILYNVGTSGWKLEQFKSRHVLQSTFKGSEEWREDRQPVIRCKDHREQQESRCVSGRIAQISSWNDNVWNVQQTGSKSR